MCRLSGAVHTAITGIDWAARVIGQLGQLEPSAVLDAAAHALRADFDILTPPLARHLDEPVQVDVKARLGPTHAQARQTGIQLGLVEAADLAIKQLGRAT